MRHEQDTPDDSAVEAPAEAAWSCEEIERLYRQALDAVEAVATDLSSVNETLSADAEGEWQDENLTAGVGQVPVDAAVALGEQAGFVAAPAAAVSEESRPEPLQVIEALLFVGGQPLSAKTLGGLMRGESDAAFVEDAVEVLNHRYSSQNRPYEIRRGEGGYRLALRSEYEPLRNRVYGFGPKQVRLSQETLEILALVAYRQPITRQRAEKMAKRNAGSALRQLVERGLLELEHPEGTPLDEAQYRTSARFLQLFGMARLDDLPQIEDLDYK